MIRDARELLAECVGAYRPPPILKPHEWVAENVTISGSVNSGKYDPAFMPFQNFILDAIADPKVEQIVFVAASQIGKTFTVTNMILEVIANDPAPVLYVRGTDSDAKNYSKNDLTPAIEGCPAMTGLFGSNRGKDSSNTLNDKKFPGGFIKMVGAQSANKLAGYAVKYAFLDEIGKYRPIPGFGHPKDLAIQRTSTYRMFGAKVVYISTPTIAGLSSDIATMYEQISDMRIFTVPCPVCGHRQELVWENVKFSHCKQADGTYDLSRGVYYECSECGHHLTDQERVAALKKIDEVKTYEGNDRDHVAGFRVSQLYSPIITLEALVKLWLERKATPFGVQQFKNEILGLAFDEDVSIKASSSALFNRRELYEAEVPLGVGLLTMTVDVQGTPDHEGTSPAWLEYQVVGHGLNYEMWIIESGIIDGSPANPDTWDRLMEVGNKVYRHECGSAITISKIGIDTQGGFTQNVLDFVKGKLPRILGLFGAKTPDAPLLPRKPTISGHRAVKTYGFGTANAKDLIFTLLENTTPGPSFIHFPMTITDEEFFRQLYSEKRIEKNGRRAYKQVRARNEQLDLLAYNIALFAMCNTRNQIEGLVKDFSFSGEDAIPGEVLELDMEEGTDDQVEQLDAELESQAPPPPRLPAKPQPKAPVIGKKRRPRIVGSSW